MAKILEIPYRSQEDGDAKYSFNDCGAACVAMVLQAFGTHISIDQLFKDTGESRKKFLSRNQLSNMAKKYGLRLKRFGRWGFAELKSSIDKRQPMIALINYGGWSKKNSGVPTQSSFSSAHFVVVVGYRGQSVYVHDPLWTGSRREEGRKKKMTYSQFEAAWGTRPRKLQSNPIYSGLVVAEAQLAEESEPKRGKKKRVSRKEIAQIKAWAAFSKIDLSHIAQALNQRAVADVYLAALGAWGKRVVEHKVTKNEDLALLALRYYNDPTKWKVIQLFNDLPALNALEGVEVLHIPEPANAA